MRTNHSLISARLIAPALFALVLTATSGRLTMAQAPEPQRPSSEVQQLKDRVTQLEQTVDELKALLKTAIDTQKKPDTASGEKVAATTAKIAVADTSPTAPVA